jgi:hypothetical protein
MTTPRKQPDSETMAALKAAKAFGLLKHLLSPLEEAAFNHAYKPFSYIICGHRLYVSAWGSKELLESSCRKLQILETLECQDRLCATVPLKHREALFDPRIILSLPPRLRNRLCRLGCYSLFAIMQRGRRFFEVEEGFTAHAINTLDQAFEKHQAKHLFH